MIKWIKNLFKPKPEDNIYTLLDRELDRLHKWMDASTNDANMNIFWKRVQLIQDKVLYTLEKQPISEIQLRHLQDQIADLYLAGKEE